jgi:hypothetical protein
MTDSGHRQPALMKRSMRSQRTRPLWLRRDDARCQSRPAWNRKIRSAGVFHRHAVVAEVSTHDRLQPLDHLRDGFMNAPLKFGFCRLQLVNASTPPLRAAPHDSGPMRVATSHSCDFFVRYTSPV